MTPFRRVLCSCLLAFSALRAAAGGSAADLLDALSSPRVEERVAAERALQPWLLAPEGVREIAARLPLLPPEARLRVREAVLNLPASGAALVVVASGGEAAARAPARDLLRELLTAEIARRGAHGETCADPGREAPFARGVITGLAWPLGDALPLSLVLEWLQETVAPNKPIVLEPGLPAAALAPVAPAELLPATASALLERLLGARGLALADLGLVRVVRVRQDAEEFARLVEERPEGDAERTGKEAQAARLLTRLLLGGEGAPADPAAAGLLFRALWLPGAADAAAAFTRAPRGGALALGDLLPLGSRAAAPEWHAALLCAALTQGLRLRVLNDLARAPALAAQVAELLFAGSDPAGRRAACWLVARVQAAEHVPAVRACLERGDPDLRLAAALALCRLGPGEEESARSLAAVLPECASGRSVRASLPAALNAALAAPRGIPPAPLLAAENPWARAIGAALLAAEEPGVPPPAGALRRDDPCALAAWALAATCLAAPPGDALRQAMPLLAAALEGDARCEGALALALARVLGPVLQGGAWVEEAEQAAAAARPLRLRVLLAIAAADLAAGEDYRAGRLRVALRQHAGEEGLVQVALRELWSALTSEGNGEDVLLFDAGAVPFWQ
ncbi:MAG: HEAT repeat domain-containing protein [Planctomycetes bacterium]|nr:HEAT repeat domain-containing protein [Planctomycetota bacterium]